MSVRLILEQLEGSYDKPDMMTIHQNNLLFQSPFLPSKAPEMLFYRIEQCQEIQMIAEDPYTPKQIISNAIRLLMASEIFPLKKFHTWVVMPNKTYPILKTFVHEAYTRRLTSIQICNTAGQKGYVRNPNDNIYNVFGEGDNEVMDNNTTTTQTANNDGKHLGRCIKCGNQQCHNPFRGLCSNQPAVGKPDRHDEPNGGYAMQPTAPCMPHWPTTDPCPTYPTVEYPSATGICGRIFSTRTRGRKRTR